MSYSPLEGLVHARRQHASSRTHDADNPAGIHPLLTTFDDVQPYPSSKKIDSMFDKVCGGKHPGHSRSKPDQCYLYYASKCNPESYGPPIPKSNSFPFDKTSLPGKAPILEHVRVLLLDQDQKKAGGSFLPFVQETVNLCSSHRQVSDKTIPHVQTIVFGKSSLDDLKQFLAAFKSEMSQASALRPGYLPSPFYSFDIEFVNTPAGTPFRLSTPSDSGPIITELPSREPMPARVHLGFYESRFDIVFPWTHTHMTDSYSADFTLEVPSAPLHSLWHDLFEKLPGHAVGIGLDHDLAILNKMLTVCYRFMFQSQLHINYLQSCVEALGAEGMS
jgi:hypothetical protein